MLTLIEDAIKEPVNKYAKIAYDILESKKILGQVFVAIVIFLWAALWFFAGLQY